MADFVSVAARKRLTLAIAISFSFSLALSVALVSDAQAGDEGASAFARECVAVDEVAMRERVEEVATDIFKGAGTDLNIRPIVQRAWDAEEDRFEAHVRRVIAAERGNRAYWERLVANYRPGVAEEMAEIVLVRVFESAEFAEISEAVGARISREIAETPALLEARNRVDNRVEACVRAFLGERYNLAVVRAFGAVVPALGAPSLGSGNVSGASSVNVGVIVAGVLAFVMRRVIAQVVRAIMTRIVGAVSLRIASALTGIGAVLLIAGELFFGAGGPFPAIEREILGPETERVIVDSFAAGIEAELPLQLASAGPRLVDELRQQLATAQRDYAALLRLIETSDVVDQATENMTVEEFGIAADLTAMLVEEGGEDAALGAFRGRDMVDAMAMPASGRSLARETSVATALAWHRAVPGRLDAVVSEKVYAALSPDSLDRQTLDAVLALEGRALRKLIVLPPDNIERLADLPHDLFGEASAVLGERALESLSSALAAARRPEHAVMLARFAVAPGNEGLLESGGLADDVLKSRDPGAALRMLESSGPARLLEDVRRTFDGEVVHGVLLRAYPWVPWAAGALFLFLGFSLWKAFRPPVKVIVSSNAGRGSSRDG